jgi:signal transduction histidine kinase
MLPVGLRIAKGACDYRLTAIAWPFPRPALPREPHSEALFRLISAVLIGMRGNDRECLLFRRPGATRSLRVRLVGLYLLDCRCVLPASRINPSKSSIHSPDQMLRVVPFNRWSAAFLLTVIALCVSLCSMAAESKKVLLLHSYGRGIEPYDSIVATFRTELGRSSVEPLVIYNASLDAEHAPESDDQQLFLELLRHRFVGSPQDVVVTIGPPAAAFYLRNRDKLFAGKPVVISALDVRVVPQAGLRPGDIVLPAETDPPRVVESMLRVLPQTQTIAVVIGDSPVERFWFRQFQRQFTRFSSRVRFEWLNDLSLEQMCQRVAALPPHSAVLYTLLLKDAAGAPHESGSALTSLLAASRAPIFSFYESEFGHGVVGGPYISQQRVGKLTAVAALRALSGQTSAVPEIRIVGYESPVYDWRELKRWSIDLRRLPAGSEVRFRPPSLWDQHRALITTAVSIFLLQAALLIGLVWQRMRRRHAERETLSLSGRLITAHEDERSWLARELHDDITQRLAGLSIEAAKLPGGDLFAESEVNRFIQEGLVQLSEDVHDLSYRLHPSVLDDLGLVEALKTECERVARSESLRVDLKATQLPQSLPKEVSLGIYRVAQEALRNVGRHAKASIVQLSLGVSDGGVRLAVSDNGSGFEPEAQTRRPSLGQASMRERIRSLGGRLDIQSAPGEGTTVRAWVPVAQVPS